MKKKLFRTMAIVMVSIVSITSNIASFSVNAESIGDNHDVLAWDESADCYSSDNNNGMRNYNEWEYTGLSYIYGYANSVIISRQDLESYRYENLSDQKLCKAVVCNYRYSPANNVYLSGWYNDSECYCRARVESLAGAVYQDSGKAFAIFTTQAETKTLSTGICRTYAGNLAAD